MVYGAADPKAGGCGSVYDITSGKGLNHRVDVEWGVLGEECGELLRMFFKKQRAAGKK